jgi:hypothetical protein
MRPATNICRGLVRSAVDNRLVWYLTPPVTHVGKLMTMITFT